MKTEMLRASTTANAMPAFYQIWKYMGNMTMCGISHLRY